MRLRPARFWGSTYADWGTYVPWAPVATLKNTPSPKFTGTDQCVTRLGAGT